MQKSSILAIAVLGLLAVPVLASNGIESGLNVGENIPAFDPHHLTGPDIGTNTCPVCKYGARPAVQVWLNTSSTPEEITAFAKLLDKAAETYKASEFKAFEINVTDCEKCVTRVKTTIQDAKYKNVAVATIASSSDAIKNFKFNTKAEVRNTVFVYKDRKVVEKFVNLNTDKEGLAKLSAAIEKVAKS